MILFTAWHLIFYRFFNVCHIMHSIIKWEQSTVYLTVMHSANFEVQLPHRHICVTQIKMKIFQNEKKIQNLSTWVEYRSTFLEKYNDYLQQRTQDSWLSLECTRIFFQKTLYYRLISRFIKWWKYDISKTLFHKSSSYTVFWIVVPCQDEIVTSFVW